MIVIRTAEDMARALDSPLDPELKVLLQSHWGRLSEYDGYALDDLALFIIIQPNDTLTAIDEVAPRPIIGGGAAFAILPEIICEHARWIELVFILSDDGFGLVLLVPKDVVVDPILAAALQDSLHAQNPS